MTTTSFTGWGRTTQTAGTLLETHDLPSLRAAIVAGSGGLLPRGLGRSYGDEAQLDGGVVLAPIAPDAPVALDEAAGTVRVSAGTSVDRALRELLPRGWCLPVLPGTRYVTIGGCIANDVHGKNHHHDGAFSHWVVELTLVDGLGRVRRLTPSEPEWRAVAGGLGVCGVITEAVIKLLPITSPFMRVRTRRFDSVCDVMAAMTESASRYHVAWVDGTRRGFGRSVLDEGDHVGGADLHYAPREPVDVPQLPVNVVRPGVIRAFNQAWWLRAPADRDDFVSFPRFFHPLDRAGEWHRLYGRRGFLQWQVVVPFEAAELIPRALRAFADARAEPALVVLKRFGAESGGLLSFPVPGWTLAVDVAADRAALPSVLDWLDGAVAEAGGRVYLAKDSRLAPETFRRMYPRWEEWRDIRAMLDPHGVFRSDLTRRLELV